MRTRRFGFVPVSLLLASATVLPAGTPSLAVRFEPQRFVLGMPYSVVVEVENLSTATIAVPAEQSIGRCLKWEVEPKDGAIGPEGPTATSSPRPASQSLEAGHRVSMRVREYFQEGYLPHFCRPGKYEIEVRVEVTGSGQPPVPVALTGRTSVEVEEPTAVDREAFEYLIDVRRRRLGVDDGACKAGFAQVLMALNGEELLRRYPASSYSAYVVFRKSNAAKFASQRLGAPEVVADVKAGLLGLDPIHVPCQRDNCLEPTEALHGAAALDWQRRWYATVLQHHPTISFADDIRLGVACDKLIEGDGPGGVADLESLAETARPELASKARQILELLRTSGWLEKK